MTVGVLGVETGEWRLSISTDGGGPVDARATLAGNVVGASREPSAAGR